MAQALRVASGTNILKWKVGDFTVTSIPESEAKTTPKFLFKEVDKKALSKIGDEHTWLKPTYVTPDGLMLQKVQALICDNGKIRMVVDTCIGNDKKRHTPGWSNLQTPFLKTMTAAGYPPDSITHVGCTHLHVDHVGWNTKLVDGQWVPTFPNARYLFARPEYHHWSTTEAASYDGDAIMQDSVEPVVLAGLADLVPVDHVVTDGIRFEPTLGHTPGHVSIVLESKGARAIITGDMCHTPVQIAIPEMSSSLDWNPAMSAETRKSFFAKYCDGETLIIGTHFGTPTAGKLKLDKSQPKLSYILESQPAPEGTRL